jgi:tetratricopeptide (TPR) repeat protein
MHRLHLKILFASCVLILTGACASLDRGGQKQAEVIPVSNVTHSAAVADPQYEIGRSLQSRRQYQPAIDAYRKSLAANPRNAEAHNAIGVIYASQGKYQEAIDEFNAALALAPRAAHIHNNLGYAYLLQGRNEEALETLKVADGLDPGNERTRENMRIAGDRLGLEPRAPAASTNAPVARTEAKAPPVDKDVAQSSPRLLHVAPSIYELREAPAVQAMSGSPSSPSDASKRLRLEIANGNGVSGLARRTSSSLQKKGYKAARLTNQTPYRQATTEIQYRKGQEDQAARLNALLSAPAKLVESSQLRSDVGVRLVLGRDAVKGTLLAEEQQRQPDSVRS